MVTIQQLASALIGVIEGEKLHAYADSGGVWTIGVGHTQPKGSVRPGMVITPQQSADFFAVDQAPLLRMLADKPLLEAAALASFGFNCGLGALGRILDGSDLQSNPRHTTDKHGTVQPGLVSRRHLEAVLIETSRQLTA